MIRILTLLSINVIMATLVLHGVVPAQAIPPRVTHELKGGEYLAITDADIQMIRKDIRFHQKQIMAANLKLTDAEAERFWPVYDRYISELDQIDDTKYALIKQDMQTGGVLTDTDAESTVKQWLEIDQLVAQLRMKYIPDFRKILSPKKTALFCQLDRHVQMTIDLQLAGSVPLIEP